MNILDQLNGINNEIMKKRLTYNGKKIYIKFLTSTYALVSHNKENGSKKFKVDVKELVEIE
jgi:hypothetical protein